MFPDADHLPAHPAQLSVVSGITFSSFFDFRFPLFRQLVSPLRETPAMPKIAVYKHGQLVIMKDEVRSARKFPDVAFPGQTKLGEVCRHGLFWSSILALDP